MRLAFAIVVVLASQSAHAQFFRCAVDGKTVYQQTPCAGGQTIDTLGAGKAAPASPANLKLQREIADFKHREAAPASPANLKLQREIADFKHRESVEAAILERQIVIGMTPDDVVRSWGNPTKINKTLAAGSASEQWVYRSKNKYVHIQNGIVSSIQSTE